uniref:Uncharacterized protein n=1 Tax=viral metagenome TaxID=1070528 RepID=A0A6M3LLL9_9ZZZZ
MTTDMYVKVGQASPGTGSEGVWADLKGNRRGEVCIVDFFTEMALEGRTYQVRAGTVTTALTGDEAITDTAAEMCVDSAEGVTFIPFEVMITWNNLGGDALECAAKSVGAASTAGTAFVPLPRYAGGIAARSTARVQAAGSVTVAAELDTTTRQHFVYAQEFVSDDDSEAEPWNPVLWVPKLPPVCKGVSCFYVQVASATTGPGYFAHIDFAELRTVNVT